MQNVGAATPLDHDKRRDSRRKRYALRASLWKVSTLPSVKGCARNVVQAVGTAQVLRDAKGVAGYAGITTCSSLWSCPCCSARIRQARAVDVETAGLVHLRQGGGLYFLTLTMPHDAADPLARTLSTVLDAWKAVQQSKGFRHYRDAHGLRFIRAVEVTHTRREDGGSGWHPHLHVLLFTDAPLSADGRADLLGKVESFWRRRIVAAGYRRPSDAHGVNLRDVHGKHNASGLLAYLTKVQDGYGESWSVGAEMARGDLKSGRRALSRTPFDLAESGAAGNGPDLALWHEYERATKGRKALHWSKGLRDLLALADVEDGDLAEVEAPAVVVACYTPTEWKALCRVPRTLSRLLDLVEAEDYDTFSALVEDALSAAPVEAPPPPLARTGDLVRDSLAARRAS